MGGESTIGITCKREGEMIEERERERERQRGRDRCFLCLAR